ncbi:MAG: phage tail sheath subtilisin-like domain-containing protein [Myxococcales bacterium]|nr:phage tail sheath subtilisin-like domain-containing protein [Myxococcales bacterium]MCB9706307.1 phage tail sheath subtilisin-like domain-containing protein [Myxococcales bacterium]
MVQVTYPGVYIQELSSGVRTIATVATSIAAFVDYFAEGPMNEAVRIQGMGDFERIFGGLNASSAASYGIAQFFQNGGGDAYVVRVAASDITHPLAKASVGLREAGGTLVASLTAVNEGAWGNRVRANVEPNADGSFNLQVIRYDGTSGTARAIAADAPFLSLTMSSGGRYFKDVIDEGSALVRATHQGSATTIPAASGTLGAQADANLFDSASPTLPASGTAFTITLNDGVTSTDYATTLTYTSAPTTLKELRRVLERAIQGAKDSDGNQPATLAGASATLIGDRYLVRLRRGATGYKPEMRATFSSGVTPLGLVTGAYANVQEYVLGGATVAAQAAGTTGADGLVPGADEIIGNRGDKTGIYALVDVDLFNILCIPRAVASDVSSSETTAIYGAALTFCEEERAFLLIDIPESKDSVDEVLDWVDDNADFKSKSSAVYFPRVMVPDPLLEYRPRALANSGTVAGIFARTDATRGVWKAPAGLDTRLRGVSDLACTLTDEQNGILNPVAINCLRTFPIHGTVVWGARTLDGADAMASEWKYVPIRRLTLMLEESLYRGTKWVVFEPNDEALWAKIRQNVRTFMLGLYRQGAFQGSSPDDAFFVKCDGETTTAGDRNRGIVNITVGFAPLKPAEFVVISIQQIPDIA